VEQCWDSPTLGSCSVGMIPGRSEWGEPSEGCGIPYRGEKTLLAHFFSFKCLKQIVCQADTERSEAKKGLLIVHEVFFPSWQTNLDCLGMALVAARLSADILALQRLKHELIQRIKVTFLNY
jgi:hypothetical protein